MDGNGGPIIIHFWKVFNITPKVDWNDAFSYIVTKMSNNHPYLDYIGFT